MGNINWSKRIINKIHLFKTIADKFKNFKKYKARVSHEVCRLSEN